MSILEAKSQLSGEKSSLDANPIFPTPSLLLKSWKSELDIN